MRGSFRKSRSGHRAARCRSKRTWETASPPRSRKGGEAVVEWTGKPRESHEQMTRSSFQALAAIAVVLSMTLGSDAQREVRSVEQQVSYRTLMVEGVSIFYREAGPKGAPNILLLHGLPSRCAVKKDAECIAWEGPCP
jgi:hypothetical protein